jgi:hypothetical protein
MSPFSKKKGLRGPEGPCWLPAEGTGDLFAARINQELKNSRKMQECAFSTNKFLIS